jgi:hypothetical protein
MAPATSKGLKKRVPYATRRTVCGPRDSGVRKNAGQVEETTDLESASVWRAHLSLSLSLSHTPFLSHTHTLSLSHTQTHPLSHAGCLGGVRHAPLRSGAHCLWFNQKPSTLNPNPQILDLQPRRLASVRIDGRQCGIKTSKHLSDSNLKTPKYLSDSNLNGAVAMATSQHRKPSGPRPFSALPPVERIRHIHDSQGHILALSFR